MTSKARRRIWILVALVGIYAAVAHFVLPRILRPQIERRLASELGRQVGVGAVKLNPFTFALTLQGVEVLAPTGVDPFLGWRRLVLDFDPLKSVRGEWVLGDVVLEDFYGAVEVREDGSVSFADLLGKLAEWRERGARSAAAWPWRVQRLTVSGARLDFHDRSRGEVFRSLIGPVNFTLTDFRTAGGRGAPYRFEARTESGERVSWSGTVTSRPLASAGEWRIDNLLLSKYAPYFDDRMTVLLTSGKLSMSGRYEAVYSADERRLVVSANTAQLEKLKLVDPTNGEPMLEISSAEAEGFSADAIARHISVNRLQLGEGRLTLRRDPEGVINLLSLFTPRRPGKPRAGAAEERPLEFAAGEIAVRDFTVEIHDRAAARPVRFELTRVGVSLKEFNTGRGAAVPVEVTFGTSPQGTGRISGELGLRPFRTTLDVELAWIPLAPLSPYFDRTVHARIARGSASLTGRFQVAPSGGARDLTFAGSGRLEEVAVVADHDQGEIAGFSNLAFTELRVGTVPRLNLAVSAINVNGPYVNFVIDEGGRLNFADLSAMPPGLVSEGGSAPDARVPPRDISLGRVTVDGGELTFTDRSVQPMVQFDISQIGGSLQNLSARNPARGEVELRGFVEGESPLIAKGRFNPLTAQMLADVQFDGKDIDLQPVAPYVSKFTGHKLEGGALFLSVNARLVEQKLELRNQLTLDQFALGEPTPSPDAIRLPVKLGVALLKDGDGRITFDAPVEGRVGDPEFHVSQLIGQVFTSTLAKAATSPFTLLGSMFGGGGEELSRQEFPLGDVDPTPESRQRLATLHRALVARPALTLELEASYDAGELEAFRRKRLEDTIRRRVWEKLRRTDQNVTPMDQLLISSRHRADMITEMFDEQFTRPLVAQQRRVQAATPAPEPAPVQPPPSLAEKQPERRGLFRRALDVATFKPVRDLFGDDEKPEAIAQNTPAPAPQPAAPPPRPPSAPPAEVAALLNLPLAEMERRLIEAMPVEADDLKHLAEARARRVKQLLVENGEIAPDRIRIAEIDPKSAAKGPLVAVHLR